jgi:uncharacterized membrane protein YesL
MLDRMFDLEGPVAQFLFRVKDLIVLNVLTLICCIPVFTIGPALKALAFTSLKMVRDEDGNVISTYFKNFKLNFKQTVLFGLVCLLLLFICAGDIYALVVFWKTFPPLLIFASIAVLFAVFSVLVYAVPMQGRFLNPIPVTFKNAFWAAIYKIGKTVIMVLSWLFLPALDLFVSGNFWPLLLFIGLSLPAYINALLYEPLFRSMENKILGVNAETEETEESEETEEPEETEKSEEADGDKP